MIATIGYTNHRGERSERTIRPLDMQYMASEWHGNAPQWVLLAEDVTKPGVREFAMADIHEWRNGECSKDPADCPENEGYGCACSMSPNT